MAHRRMFSKAIVGSARFLKMPVDSQSLYFHLGMATDDDGVVEAWAVLRETGSAEDNLRVLASKGFVKVLNEDLVSYILDWNEHNELRPDRIKPSQYRELLVQVLPEVKLVEPRRRADLKGLPSGRPVDDQRTEEDRLGKVSINNTSVADTPQIVRVSEEEERPKKESRAKYPHSKEVFSVLFGSDYEREWNNNTTQLRASEAIYKKATVEGDTIQDFADWRKKHEGCEYFPQADSPHEMNLKWPKFDRHLNECER